MVEAEEKVDSELDIVDEADGALSEENSSRRCCGLVEKARRGLFLVSMGKSKTSTGCAEEEATTQNSNENKSDEQDQIKPKCEVSQLRDDMRRLRHAFRGTTIPPHVRLAKSVLVHIEELENRARRILYPDEEGWYSKGWWTLKGEELRDVNKSIDQDAMRAMYSWLVHCSKTATAILDVRDEKRRIEQESLTMSPEEWEPVEWEECGPFLWEVVEREELLTKTRKVFPVRDPPPRDCEAQGPQSIQDLQRPTSPDAEQSSMYRSWFEGLLKLRFFTTSPQA